MGHHATSTAGNRSSLVPRVSSGNDAALHLESALQDLHLHQLEVELSQVGWELAQIFEHHPLLPGAVLVDGGQFAGMISRQRLLEFLIRPHGMELFLQKPLWVVLSYARCELLILPGETPILMAAHQALRRSPHLLNEPIIVQLNDAHYLLDVHELNIAHWQIRGIETQVRYERTQAQMIQSDKMASLGRLVDGVAHEILDPVSFIWGNLSHITTYSQELLQLLALYERYLPQPPADLVQLQTEMELDYLRADLPRAIESVKAGAERLSKLASSLQNFCHIDEVYPKPTDLHEAIDGILLLLKSRLSSDIQIVKHYGHLPPVVCYPGQLNQVFMNILSTCLDSLLIQAVSQQLDQEMQRPQLNDAPVTYTKPTLEITTQICNPPAPLPDPTRWVSIRIADNGPGLSKEVQRQLLESFSVKQRTEKETSLAVSYQIVTAKHGGKFKVRSHSAANQEMCRAARGVTAEAAWAEAADLRTGTEFEIFLPLG